MTLWHTIIDTFLHLQEHLHQLTQSYGPWIYALLFLVLFCETGLVITPFLPGDSLIFAVGAVAADPAAGLNVGLAGALILTAAILGDSVNYTIGRFAGLQLLRRFPRLIKPKHLDATHAFFHRYGGKTIVLARFVPLMRTFVPFAAGSGQMAYRRFMFYNVAGALLWVGLILPAGWFFGQIPFVKAHFELVLVGIVFASLVPVAFEILKNYRLRPVPAMPPRLDGGLP